MADNIKTTNLDGGAGQILAIRDIIFGPIMQEYAEKFDALEEKVNTERNDLDNSISKTNAQLVEMLQNLEARLSEQIKKITKKY